MQTWKGVVGYESLYMVSDHGQVLSIITGMLLKLTIGDTGYHCISLYKNGHTKRVKVHRLVAEAFIPNPDSLPTVNHIDFNKLNNHPSNLEWCTLRQNLKHYDERGRKSGKYKLGGNYRLNKTQILEIKELCKNGIKAKHIAEKYKISRSHVSNIKTNRKWVKEH